jgi:CheY-like chemotaxis protein/tetratricopeptide (TPR) repeat protein
LAGQSVGGDEQALTRCRAAAEFVDRGDYDSACEALGPFWKGVGVRPALGDLGDVAAAEVLLAVGTVTGWIGSCRQIEGAQDAAKDLISESASRFDSLGLRARASDAKSELGFCYRRAGAYDEARVIYEDALREVPQDEHELKAKILLRLAIVESCSQRYNDALRILTDSALLFERAQSDLLKGKFHNELGNALHVLSRSERRTEYLDRAIIEYTAASHHFELSGNVSHRALAENNLGFLLSVAGRYDEAHRHLNRARALFEQVGEKGRIAQVDDARARVMLKEGKVGQAMRVIRTAVGALEHGGENALLAEALTTQGLVFARAGEHDLSKTTLRRAAKVAEEAGAPEDAGLALLTLVEEHVNRLDERDALRSLIRAEELLAGTQDAETAGRLNTCAFGFLRARAQLLGRRVRSSSEFWEGFNLQRQVRAYEGRYIRRALIDADGSVTAAARLLGFPAHGYLQTLLKGRHKNLNSVRRPPEPRRRSIIKEEPRQKGRAGKKAARKDAARQAPAVVWYVEDNHAVAEAVSEILADDGHRVTAMHDGAAAAAEIESSAPCDLLIVDYDLPSVDGLELVRRARGLARRALTPIVMLSAADVEAEARSAGVDVFLRKPDDIGRLTDEVRGLLERARR